MKIPKLAVFIAGLETSIIVFFYWLHDWALRNGYLRSGWRVYSETEWQFWIDPVRSGVLFFLFFNGICLLTVGLCGFGRRYFNNYKNLFTVIVAILVPSTLFSYLYLSLSNLVFG